MYNGVAIAGGGFNPLSAGSKTYGGGRSMPTLGPVDPMGYKNRDLKLQARRNAMLQQIQAMQGQNYMSSASLGGPMHGAA